MASDSEQHDSSRHFVGRFATTQWSMVLAAGTGADADANRALENLCRAYWPPLYAFIRRRVRSVHEAQDLTQAFFAEVFEKRYLIQVNPAQGRFRAFLITALKHFLSKEWDKRRALKRGGGRALLSLDFGSDQTNLEPVDEVTAEKLFEREWAIALLTRVMDRLQREMEQAGKGRHFYTLKAFIGGSTCNTYAEAAADLGLNVAAARMAASRLRGRYRELLHEEISQTVATPEEIEDEIQQLFAALAN